MTCKTVLQLSTTIAALTPILGHAQTEIVSPNVVGQATIVVPAGGYAMLANPLNATNNNINTVLALPEDGSFDGANVFRFNCTSQAYRETMSFVSGSGWLSSETNPTLAPGEGFFIQNIAGVPMPITFIGEVLQGQTLTPTTVPGAGRYCLLGSKFPLALPLGHSGSTNPHLNFPAGDGDNIFIFDASCQCYRETYSYVPDIGWLHSVDGPDGPVINIGMGFFVQKIGTSRSWTQSFTVN